MTDRTSGREFVGGFLEGHRGREAGRRRGRRGRVEKGSRTRVIGKQTVRLRYGSRVSMVQIAREIRKYRGKVRYVGRLIRN